MDDSATPFRLQIRRGLMARIASIMIGSPRPLTHVVVSFTVTLVLALLDTSRYEISEPH